MYIRATGNISPQNSFGHQAFLTEPVTYTGNRLACIEPDYKNFIDAKLIRRMSRIIKMGVAAAMECLQEAAVTKPDAIVTGTAYGCLEDTVSFITKMVEYNEETLTPTAFIQSTHNTIGAQIGLMLQCNNYNNAFVHRGFSFESALLDGMMLLKENEVENVLVGAIDEITNVSHTILNRMGIYKQTSNTNTSLYENSSKGTIAGEGAAFFLLINQHAENDYAKLDGLHTFYKPTGLAEVTTQIEKFLAVQHITTDEIDLIILGKNGDATSDKIYDEVAEHLFSKSNTANYKNLCGEYPTSTAFALWLGANIIKTGSIPTAVNTNIKTNGKIKRVLIYNHYQNAHHSLLLLSAC
jgi:3-oxoacyl-[acyl-carrier-protein] synthase II